VRGEGEEGGEEEGGPLRRKVGRSEIFHRWFCPVLEVISIDRGQRQCN
jgi:hypothetical protein